MPARKKISIITGDSDLLVLGTYDNTTILNNGTIFTYATTDRINQTPNID